MMTLGLRPFLSLQQDRNTNSQASHSQPSITSHVCKKNSLLVYTVEYGSVLMIREESRFKGFEKYKKPSRLIQDVDFS